MIDVTVTIPEDRVADFYELVGRWLSGGLQRTGADLPEPADSPAKEWTDTEGDVRLARVVWEKLSPRAMAVFSLLMAHPGRKLSGDDLAATVKIPNGKYGIAGVLAWPGRHCAAVDRRPLWRWESGPPGGSASFWVDKEVADLFERVR
jgi:hypothetical protein